MNQTFKQLYQRLLKAMPTIPALYLMYFRGYHRILNLNHPKYYGEKIQWMKLHGGLEELSLFVDKYEVRSYVERVIGPNHVIKLIGLYNNSEEIDFDSLPNRFVIKCTNGSQAVLICTDKSSFDVIKAKRTIDKWLSDEYYKMKKEFQYKNVVNRIIIEEYLEDDSGELRDYKFYCFDGQPLWYSIFTGRFSNKTVDTYSISGDFLPDFKNGNAHIKTSDHPLPRLEKLDELITFSKKLSEPFTFVRVDFYIVNNQIFFGELTFTDGAGCEPMFPLEKYDVEFGKRIPLCRILKEKTATDAGGVLIS